MLEISHLTKTYTEGMKAVDDLSLTVEAGDIYGFIGRNGAGKTTTIKSVCGIMPFDEGSVHIDGMSIAEHPIECKQVTAYIPDTPDLYDFMTGAGYIMFVADMYSVPPDVLAAKLAELGPAFDMEHDLGQPIALYSHGMKQKVAIMAALVHDPKLLVLDEPFVGLDPVATHTVKGYMEKLTAAGGAIFFSTHVLEVAEKLCNKVAIIKSGKLIESGPTHEVTGKQSLEAVFLELSEDA